MIRVKFLHSNEVFLFTPTEFFHYLVGLSSAGRHPELHITPSVDDSNNFSPVAYYEALIIFKN